LKLCQNIPRSSSKRDVDVLEVADERPFKKKCVTFTNEDDIDWLKREMGDIKEGMMEITKYLRGDVDSKLEEVLEYVRGLSEP
jgi:hypothetical protein